MGEADDEVLLDARILKWGNSYGIRFQKADLERAGFTAGTDVKVRVSRQPGKIDLSHIRFFHGGRSDVSEKHDEYLGKARLARLRRKRRARR